MFYSLLLPSGHPKVAIRHVQLWVHLSMELVLVSSGSVIGGKFFRKCVLGHFSDCQPGTSHPYTLWENGTAFVRTVLLVFLSFYFCDAGDWSQDLTQDRQAPYLWAACPVLDLYFLSEV